jgi:D-alanyl-D-alanine endopeptidase (penicillin-binding protein 7)
MVVGGMPGSWGGSSFGSVRWVIRAAAAVDVALAAALVCGAAAAQAPSSAPRAVASASGVRAAPPASLSIWKPRSPPANARPKARLRAAASRRAAARTPPPPSVGRLAGLHRTEDELALESAVALVVDSETAAVLFSKNADAVLPIASITKLMTALVVVESGHSLEEVLVVTPEDAAATAGSRQRRRLAPGTRLSRGELMRLALMSSENRAAHALGRSHPGGLPAFVAAMNAKARLLGMTDTRYVEPTGLSSDNRSSAHDLSLLVRAAAAHPAIRDYSTSTEASVGSGRRQLHFGNTNGLVHHPEWEIDVQKTGYIAAAGRWGVMQAQLAGRQLIVVLLDSAGRASRLGDAERLRRWLLDALDKAPTASPLRATAGALDDRSADAAVASAAAAALQPR